MFKRLSVLAFVFTSLAQAGVYSFGGGCASLGAWSQAALSQTRAIVQIVESLKDNPACKGIETIVPKIKIAQDLLNTPENEIKRTDRIESIPNEINALRNFAVASPELKANVMKLLTSRTVEGAGLAVEAASTTAAAAGAAAGATGAAGAAAATNPAAAIALGLSDLAVRSRRATLTGLDMLDQTFSVLPALDRCLIGAPDQGMALIGASVKLLAAFASSQDGVPNRLSHTISNLVSLVRNRKFTSVLRKLDQSEFWLSMSCLMETTSQSYCSARDSRKLLDYGIRAMKPVTNPGGDTRIQNPLEGYYVLVRDIPNVSTWLQKIQFGITPKLSTDASFKNRVWSDVTDLMMDINTLRGFYSEQMLTYSTLADLESKQNFMLKLVKDTTGQITSGGFEGGGRTKVNFFEMGVVPALVPFKLIGMDRIPEEVSVGTPTKPPIDWDAWMRNGNNNDYQPQFKDPDALAKIVGQQLEVLIDAALTKASLYFQQRMIVDMSNLVTESVTSQILTVVHSLKRISGYLAVLEKKIIEKDGDLILVPSIRNTRLRIKRVLDAYEDIRRIAAEGLNDLSGDEKAINDAYKKVIETAYEQFNILLQRDTFLATRLSTFIHYDYAWRIRTNEDMTSYEQTLLLESGKDLLNRILGSTGQNPTALANDLASAQVVNKRNLEALEAILKDSLYPALDELKLISAGRPPTDSDLNHRSLYRLMRDTYGRYLGFGSERDRRPGTSMAFSWAFPMMYFMNPFAAPTDMVVRHWMHPDLYPFHWSPNPTIRGADDEFGSFNQFRSKLCIQTLSFEDRKFFEPVCKGAVLKSAFDTNNSKIFNVNLNANYNAYMDPTRRDKPVTADSICAFQNYSRKNLVHWMVLDLEKQ